MLTQFQCRLLQVLFALLATLGAVPAAMAESDKSTVLLLPKYQQECVACHLAFPPGMLSSASWRRIMTTLPQHYGTDASLDPATVKELTAWLSANAGTYKRVTPTSPDDRITTTGWFVREHRGVAPDVWKRTAVGSRANCIACHTSADKGDFNDDSIRIPR